jgi:hypothetical protein
MQTYYIINPRRGAEIPSTKISAGAKHNPVEPKVFNNTAFDDASLHGTLGRISFTNYG